MPRGRRRDEGAGPLLLLGRGLLVHPANESLRRRLVNSSIAAPLFYRQVQFLFFRIAFSLLAARRGLLESNLLSTDTRQLFRRPCGEPLLGLEDCRLDAPELRAVAAAIPVDIPDLGGLYLDLLGLHPQLDVERRTFDLLPAGSRTRKRTGSYYTPASLIERLLRSTLDYCIEEVLARSDPATNLAALTVCDPSCGSGHFLLAAARRLAVKLASLLNLSAQDALRLVARHCLYGVDRDPLAVELCKVSLWLECADPGLPLSFLDEHIRCCNSLVGAAPSFAGADPDLWTATGFGAPHDGAKLAARHGFFHWQREFPDVFPHPGQGGFDVVLGNPPWERVKFQEKDWPGAAGELEAERQRATEMSTFLRRSGRFPLSARGDLNYYGPFVETSRMLVRPGGRIGLVVPSGLATDDSMKHLFQALMRDGLVSWFDFHNRRGLFPGVQGNIKFGLLTLSSVRRERFTAAAQLADPNELDEPGRTYELTAEQITRLNPNTLHCPTFAGVADAALVSRLHERFPVLMREGDAPANPWGIRLWTMFHMTKDLPLFRHEETLRADGWRLTSNIFHRKGRRYLPLYESKLIQAFTHRAATFAGVPEAVRFRTHARTRPVQESMALPRYWVAEEAVRARAGDASWFLGFRNAISAVADARSLMAAVIPRAGVGNSLPLISGLDAPRTCLLLALLNSFVLDYVLRQKASGGNLNFHVLRQLPVPAPDQIPRPLATWLVDRVLELTYTSSELADFAREGGHAGPVFPHEEERRWRVRCEIDAVCFRLYGLTRVEVEHVLASFTVLERRERSRHGCFPSRDAILELFEGMNSFRTVL